MSAKTEKKFTFIGGYDDFLVAHAGKAVYQEKRAYSGDGPVSEEIISGQVNNLAELEKAIKEFCEAVYTLPMFASKKLVWFKDLNFLNLSQTGKSEGAQKQGQHFQEALLRFDPKIVDVLVTACPIDRRNRTVKWLEKEAPADYQTVGDSKKKDQSLDVLILQEAEAAGVSLTDGARRALLAKVNNSARMVSVEIEKLSTYLGPDEREIKEQHVLEMVPDFGESDFFEVAEAFESNDITWMLAAIQRHFFTNKDARGILISLERRNRLMIQLRALIDAKAIRVGWGGMSKAALEKIKTTYAASFQNLDSKSTFNLFAQNPWYLGRLAESANRRSLKQLLYRQNAFIRAFESILTRPDEQEEVIRALAVSCL